MTKVKIKIKLMNLLLAVALLLGLSSTNVFVSPVVAADFGTVAIGDILHLQRLPSGNLIAVGSTGKVAEFNYVAWSIISNGIGTGTDTYYDSSVNKVLLGDRYVYDVASNTWSSLPFTLEANMAWYGNKIYKFSGRVIYDTTDDDDDEWYHQAGSAWKYNFATSTWDVITIDAPVGGSTERLGSTATYAVMRAPTSNLVKLRSSTSPSNYYYSADMIFDMQSETFTGATAILPVSSDDSVNTTSKNHRLIHANVRTSSSYSSPTIAGVTGRYTTSYDTSTANPVQNPISKGSSDAYNFPWTMTYSGAPVLYNTGTKVNVGSLSFVPYTATTDKYGNVAIGGAGGNFVVQGSSGTSYVTSTLYTDYILADSKDNSYDAKTAAEAANTTMNTIIAPQLSEVHGALVDGSGNTVLSISQSTLTNLDSVKEEILKSKADSNLKFNDLVGKGGALATKGTTFNYFIDHEGANEYQVKLDNGSWSTWTSLATHDAQSYLSVPVSTIGPHTLSVKVRNNTGGYATPEKQKTLTFFKLQ